MGRPGFVMVIAAPSGTGKTTLAHALVERCPGVEFSVSATTRRARDHEEPGADYHFVSSAEFDRMIDDGALIEWAEVHGRRYGTQRAAVTETLARGATAVLDIDIQGARQIRREFPDAVLVFILPPSGAELDRRLATRGTEDDAQRMRRIRAARRELPGVREFDYVVVNDDFDAAVAALAGIVSAERGRVTRQTELDRELERLDAELAEILEGS